MDKGNYWASLARRKPFTGLDTKQACSSHLANLQLMYDSQATLVSASGRGGCVCVCVCESACVRVCACVCVLVFTHVCCVCSNTASVVCAHPNFSSPSR